MPHLEAVAKNGTMVPRRVLFCFLFQKRFPRGLCKIVRCSARWVCFKGGSFGGTRSTPLKRLLHNSSTCAGLRVPVSIHTDCTPRRPHSFCYHCLLVSGSVVDILYPKHCWFLNSSFPASGCLQLIRLNYVDINIYAYGKGLFHVSLKHRTFWPSSFYRTKQTAGKCVAAVVQRGAARGHVR